MLTRYDKNGNQLKLVQDNDLAYMAKSIMCDFKTLSDIENVLKTYEGQIINGYNSEPITVAGIRITAWTRWFFSYATLNESFGMAVHPGGSPCFFICRVNNGWIVKQII